jgi:hypothetical protein
MGFQSLTIGCRVLIIRKMCHRKRYEFSKAQSNQFINSINCRTRVPQLDNPRVLKRDLLHLWDER